jgi:hypothetical protein
MHYFSSRCREAISSLPCTCSFSYIGGIAKEKRAKLRHLILLSRVSYILSTVGDALRPL